MRKKIVKRIIRKCLVCGKKVTVKLHKGGTHENAYYFGILDIPIEGTGENKKVGTCKFFGKNYPVVKWTGKERQVEYWECEKCYRRKSKDAKPLLDLKGKRR